MKYRIWVYTGETYDYVDYDTREEAIQYLSMISRLMEEKKIDEHWSFEMSAAEE